MAKAKKLSDEVKIDRRVKEQRKGGNRRKSKVAVATEQRVGERRKKAPRRRQIDPTTCERDYTTEEIEFMRAMDLYKRTSGRMFPTCSEILEVVRGLGYVKQASSCDALPSPVTTDSESAEVPAAEVV